MDFILAITLITWQVPVQEGNCIVISTTRGGLTLAFRLSAIMLGRLRMTIAEAMSQYTWIGNHVFANPRWFHTRSLLWWPRPKYATAKMRQAVLEVIESGLRDQSLTNYDVETTLFMFATRYKKRCHR
jgi:hypothetical protein